MENNLIENALTNESLSALNLFALTVGIMLLLGVFKLLRGKKPIGKFRVKLGKNRSMVCCAKGAVVEKFDRHGNLISWENVSVSEACRRSSEAARRYSGE